jgi:hypothetical protein
VPVCGRWGEKKIVGRWERGKKNEQSEIVKRKKKKEKDKNNENKRGEGVCGILTGSFWMGKYPINGEDLFRSVIY